MTDITSDTIALETAIERLRQERETFDQAKQQEDRWFKLRLRMGYAAAIMLPVIAAACVAVILQPGSYSGYTVGAATSVLFSDVVGLILAIWKVVLSPSSVPKLTPVTSTKQLDSIAKNPTGATKSQR